MPANYAADCMRMAWAGKTVLVTGATGFIGSHLAARLMQEGAQVRLLVRNPGKLAKALRGCDIVTGDLADMQALATAVRGADILFHCAANVATWDSAAAYEAVNVTGLANLLQAVLQHNPALARFVHLSTVDVYGFPTMPCDEMQVLPPTGFGYGDSKAAGEALLRSFCSQHDIAYTILRPCNVIGPGSQFIARIGQELTSGLMLKIDSGRANAGMLFVGNLIDYLLWAANAPIAAGQCYNLRDDYDVSWAEFLTQLRQRLKGRGLVITLPFAVAEACARVCELFYRAFLPGKEPLLHRLLVRIFGRTCGHSAAKFQRDSGLTGKVGFDEAMAQSARWFQESRK